MTDQNPILLEVFKNRFCSIAEEMGVALNRTAFSPNIKERRDFSCAVFDRHGDMVAQAAHIPVHLGSMPLSVKSAIDSLKLSDGDMVMLNDPFRGGTHLPDITCIAPVCTETGEALFYVANRAHHADIGGMASGSMPLSTSIFQEGLIIPPVKIISNGKINHDLLSLVLNNVRTPREREGDFTAQIMANLTGATRMKELMAAHGLDKVVSYADRLIRYAEKMTRETIRRLPDGFYSFEDVLDDDGVGAGPVSIAVDVHIRGDEAVVDFSRSGRQVAGSVNAVYAITLSCVMYVFRSLISGDIPTNAGSFRPIQVKTVKGSVVDAQFPSAVAGGNVETSQRIVDVLLGALAKAIPDRIPAAGQGTMNNIAIGGIHPKTGASYAYYETIGGGMGACAFQNGESAVQCHMTNTLNTPVEALEYSYPFRVTRYGIRKGSGGKGRYTGGDGIVREIQLLADAEVTVLSDRRRHPPYGLEGGRPGKMGRNQVIRCGRPEKRPGKFHEILKAGDIIRIETPGGGGYGTRDTEPEKSENKGVRA